MPVNLSNAFHIHFFTLHYTFLVFISFLWPTYIYLCLLTVSSEVFIFRSIVPSNFKFIYFVLLIYHIYEEIPPYVFSAGGVSHTRILNSKCVKCLSFKAINREFYIMLNTRKLFTNVANIRG